MPSQTDLAWAAGIIDGEGCIFISRIQPTPKNRLKQTAYRFGLKVTMGHEPTIEKLKGIFGDGSRHGVNQRGWNKAYTWLVWSRQAAECISLIKPYCLTKADEILVAEEFLALPGWYGGQFRGSKSVEYSAKEYQLWDRMRRLKPRTLLAIAKQKEEQDA